MFWKWMFYGVLSFALGFTIGAAITIAKDLIKHEREHHVPTSDSREKQHVRIYSRT